MPRTDDDCLAGEAILWRRIVPSWITYKDGRHRPGSFAFVDRLTFEVSVFVASLTDESALMEPYPADSLVGFPASLPRSLGAIVAATPENSHPGHRVIVYQNAGAMKKASQILARKAEWVRFKPPTS